MKVSVFGLGYVGCVSAACFAHEGHYVIGVDVDRRKTNLIDAGESPIVEKGLAEIIKTQVENGRLIATNSTSVGIKNSQLSLICVGTPSRPDGSLNLDYVKRVAFSIGNALADKDDYHVIVMRSTVLPSTLENVVIPILEDASGKQVGVDFGVCMHPEFLREGSAIKDFYNPPKIVIGQYDEKSGDALEKLYNRVEEGKRENGKTRSIFASLFSRKNHQDRNWNLFSSKAGKGLSPQNRDERKLSAEDGSNQRGFDKAPLIRTTLKAAEMVKYADNAFHALKITFANEIGNICKQVGIDSHQVMDIFCLDTKLNLSPYYLKPGFAFGGSCLPKDLRALTSKANQNEAMTPLLGSILYSNENQLMTGIRMVMDTGKSKIGMLGLSFKAGTDDLRESPLLMMAEQLAGMGYQLKIFDPCVMPSNPEFSSAIPHPNKGEMSTGLPPYIAPFMCASLDEVLEDSEVIVIGNKSEEYAQILDKVREGQTIIDLVRIVSDVSQIKGDYQGICW